MADERIRVRIVFKAVQGQQKNPEEDYDFLPAELDRLISEMRSADANRRPNYVYGAYEASRYDRNTSSTINTRIVIRFEDVLYIG